MRKSLLIIVFAAAATTASAQQEVKKVKAGVTKEATATKQMVAMPQLTSTTDVKASAPTMQPAAPAAPGANPIHQKKLKALKPATESK